jgi:DNA topoisomerase-1
LPGAAIIGAMGRLRRVDPCEPGIVRRRRGRGFEYRYDGGERVTDEEVLERISELVIPPAWEDVWICPYPLGHIQATGIDAAGRKQYRYHDKWRERRDREKFDSMLAFARALPRLRAGVAEDLAGNGMGRERVLACAVRLLDRGFFRVGGEGYAAENETYGLATMQKQHVTVGRDGAITFDYPAKRGQRRLHRLMDEDAYEVVKTLRRRRGGGPELLAYRRGRRWYDIRSEDINEYLKRRSGAAVTAKDFRTWNATTLAAVALAVSAPAAEGSKTARKRAVTRAVKEVAHYLGNTPAVARASYIDPRVWERFEQGLTIGGVLVEVGDDGDLSQGSLLSVEDAVLELLEEGEGAERVEKVA